MKLELVVLGTASEETLGIRNVPPHPDNQQVKQIQFWDGTGQF